jgi:catalase
MSSTNDNPIQTTDSGIPVESDQYSLTVGAGGPILLQDSYLIEQMANFNRERITERQPHAKGSGAFGRFEVTNDVSAFTKAALFQPGSTTRLVSRFSTVAGERGSPDIWRDLRGFSLRGSDKMFTQWRGSPSPHWASFMAPLRKPTTAATREPPRATPVTAAQPLR